MRVVLLVALAIVIGSAVGTLAALRVRAASADPPATAPDSYYFGTLRTTGMHVPEMTPLLLTPRAGEAVPPSCPLLLTVVAGNGSYAHGVAPYLDALRPAAHTHPVTRALANAWERFRRATRGPVTTPPVRILVKHYPRPELPGRCVTLQVTVYDVVDTYLDKDEPAPGGALLDVLATYQLDGGAARIVEAVAQVQTGLRPGAGGVTLGEQLGMQDLGRMIGWIGPFDAHFTGYGGGSRRGMVWVDRRAGIGEPDGWGTVFSIDGSGHVDKRPLSADLIAWLVGLAGRA